MKIIFWGTPESAVPFLEFLYPNEQVLAVVTQPDKPAERGQKIQKSPVKQFAEEKKISVFQPAALKETAFLSSLSDLKPELGMIVAYGKILPKEVLQLFPKGIFNVHFSLLPHLRGAAPIQWAILRGDKKTGITIFRISETLDSGNIVCQKEVEISNKDNAISLEKKLIPLGMEAMKEVLEALKNGNLKEIPQKGEGSYAPRISKEQAKIDWNKSAEEIDRQVRALVKIGAYTKLTDGRILKILQAEAKSDADRQAFRTDVEVPVGLKQSSTLGSQALKSQLPVSDYNKGGGKESATGTFCGIEKGKGFFVKCKVGQLFILKVQPEGKKEMDAWSFLQGSRLKIGEQFH